MPKRSQYSIPRKTLPNLSMIRKILDLDEEYKEESKGIRLSNFNAKEHTLDRFEKDDMIESLQANGAELVQLNRGADIRDICIKAGTFRLLKDPEVIGKPAKDLISRYEKEGLTPVAFHFTNLLQYSLICSHWSNGTLTVDRSREFFMTTSITADSDLDIYLEGGKGTINFLETLGVKITDNMRRLAALGVILAVDLKGYLHYPVSAERALFMSESQEDSMTVNLMAPSPPPINFTIPLAVATFL